MFSRALFGRKRELISQSVALTVASTVTTTCCPSKYLYQPSVCGTRHSLRVDQLLFATLHTSGRQAFPSLVSPRVFPVV